MPWFLGDNPYVHNDLAWIMTNAIPYYGRVPYFLILAGYFLARNITWNKAIDRAVWLLIPFVIWNIVYYVWKHKYCLSFDAFFSDFPKTLGVGAIFSRATTISDLEPSAPSISVSWFLRDIIVLSILTPILTRFRRVLVILLVIACAFTEVSQRPDSRVLLSFPTCFYYLLGMSLVDFRISDAYRILHKKFTPFLVLGVVTMVALCLYPPTRKFASTLTLMGPVFGAMMIAQCGVLIETHLPRLSKRLAPCGPACFFVFMLHEPIALSTLKFIPEWLRNSWVMWFYPFFLCAFIISLFLMMKEYAPCLLPYLGHMKKPKKQTS